MQLPIRKRLIMFLLSAVFTLGIYYGNHLAWTLTQDRRDRWQKPEEVIHAIGLKSGQVIIDIGAGEGYFTERFAKVVAPGGRAVGLEIKSDLVDKMKERAQRLGLASYEARLVDTDDPQLAPNSIDVVFLCDAYHHISNRIAYFKQIKPALRAGGRLVVVDMVRTERNPDHSVVKEEVVEELHQAGYRLQSEHGFLLPKQYLFIFESTGNSKGSH